ncbi:hypothetical protein LTR36_000500 [Oleoguttula mirabilis]|uniref:Uncharacterized protein n=1 Tax=Oleoguttula mirabilis TaxID=1507867 RepID=A0AAV9JQQ0_9PEZI|nr:hypothetical protein LTR36_000500 [Oleoguttula mirabilis]
MAAERLRHEVATGDLPTISLGNFNWQPVEKRAVLSSRARAAGVPGTAQTPIAAQRFLDSVANAKPAAPLTEAEFPLNQLQLKTFAGTGYNVVWRPRPASKDPGQREQEIQPRVKGVRADVLELNLTAETMAFTGSLGDVPNRGSGHAEGPGKTLGSQRDIMLKGISYIQRVGAFENNLTGSNNHPEPAGIHFEPGVFMLVPASENPKQPATLNRMASIPHGTTINAQGPAPTPATLIKGPMKPNDINVIPKESIVPFDLNNPESRLPTGPNSSFPHLEFPEKASEREELDRLPSFLSKFTGPGKIITKEVFQDPNQILRDAILGQEIDSFAMFDLATKGGLLGGQTANIGFLEGTPDQLKAGFGNAHAIKMTVRYWIETVGKTLTVQAKQTADQIFEMPASAAGVLAPKFVVSAAESTKLKSDIKHRFTWTQIQYSQNVTLNFNGLSWPHVSVATLGDTSTITVTAEDLGGVPIKSVL